MKTKALFTILILLYLTLNALASVLPIPRHVQLSKRGVNTNFNNFEHFEFPNLSQQDLQNLFQSDMNNAAALAFSATAQLNQQNVATTPEFQRWFGANSNGRVNQILQGYQNIVHLFSLGNTRSIPGFPGRTTKPTPTAEIS
ncbi:hypothetical protein ABVK25_010333 [Lepraria finkii]|uniref:Uncharacterized protein n=1 Tax=Lepraria finkii TaxID=1340010 RepID=A0ABR4AXN9_9LECA